MTEQWRVLMDGPVPAVEQMAFDGRLAHEARLTVRFFRWEPPAVSVGRKQLSPDWLKTPMWCSSGMEVVERPTGGGIAFHGSDLSLAVIVPRVVVGLSLDALMSTVCQSAIKLCDTYASEAEAVLDAERAGRITYCLLDPSPYAVFVDGRKIAGFALRRYQESWLIQGSLLIGPLPEPLTQAMPGAVQCQLQERAVSLAEAAGTALRVEDVMNRWAAHWAEWWAAPRKEASLPYRTWSTSEAKR